MHDHQIESLRRATPRVLGRQPACGVCVAPGLIATCAHVVGRGAPLGTAVPVHRWGEEPFALRLLAIDDQADLALLGPTPEDPRPGPLKQFHPVLLDGLVERGDAVAAIGFPLGPDRRPEVDELGARVEAETRRADGRRLLKLEGGQFRPGFSGGALLNRRTGRACGLVNETRNEHLDLGGYAIPIDDLIAFCADHGRRLPMPSNPVPAAASAVTAAELVDALVAVLQRLPDWRNPRHRRLFIEQALLGHPRLAELHIDGPPADDARTLALAGLDPRSGDPAIACRLLRQFLDRPIGNATRSEAEGLLRRLGRGGLD